MPDRLRIILALATAFCLAACQSHAEPPPATLPSAELPLDVEKFRSMIARMNANAVLTEAIAEFGQPSRDIGFGLSIPQWDLAGGVLTVHPWTGPTFRAGNGDLVWLIPTRNPVRENLLQDFEMTTLPDPTNHGTIYPIGNVHITKDGNYRYVDNSSSLSGNQSSNFFINHSEGQVEIVFAPGVDANSRLEDLGDRKVARFRFIARDAKTVFECGVESSARSRRLSIVGSSFIMECGWLNFWAD